MGKMKRMSLISTLVLLTLMVSYCNCQCESIAPSSSSSSMAGATTGTTMSKCKVRVSESIPLGVSYPSGPIFSSTIDDLLEMCNSARRTLDIASFYWTLQGTDVMPDPDNSSAPGEHLLNCYIDAAKNRGVKVRIAVSQSMGGSEVEQSTDLKRLKLAGAEIRVVNFTKLVGAGVLHTKFVIGDNETFYIGSANMDWRSFTQVKEMGVLVSKCPILGQDLAKVFQVYWYLGDSEHSFIPSSWPSNFQTNFNAQSPLEITLNGTTSRVYISSSPLPLNPVGRANDVDAILDTIDKAKKFINIAVMDYFPVYLFTRPSKFWPVIDDALKKTVIERGVKVRLLISKWSHTRKSIFTFLKSLDAFRTSLGWNWGKIEVKLYQVPSTPAQEAIPFARVNHNKYMVTDEIAYVGTNNWSADYFTNTGGVAFVSHETNSSCYHPNGSLRDSLLAAFERDWNSQYSHYISEYKPPKYTLQ